MKILYISSFSNTEIENYLLSGGELNHTMFGFYTIKSKGYDITWYAADKNDFLVKIFRSNSMIRSILVQVYSVFICKKYDVIYCGQDMHLFPLSVLRLLRLCRKPIYIVSHFTYDVNKIDSSLKKYFKKLERYFVYKGIDKISFASESIMENACNVYNVPQRHRNFVNWGANLTFFDSFKTRMSNEFKEPTLDFFSAIGGANRDYDTLVKAFEKIDFPLNIFGKYDHYENEFPVNITFHNLTKHRLQGDVMLRKYYYNSIAILLPIKYLNDVPNGATVLVEALAMGKPIIITEAVNNYLDVEKEGVGLTVKRNDADDWQRVINFLLNNPENVKQMGEKAYNLAKTKYGDELFVNNILENISSLHSVN